MGTYYGYNSKNELRDELRREMKQKIIADRTVGNKWWAVLEWEDGSRLLFLAKMSVSQGDWGYKPLSEEMGLYDCDCPESLLKMVEEAPLPEALGEQTSEWVKQTRDRIRNYHKARKRVWEPGDQCTVFGEPYEVTATVSRTYCYLRKEGDDQVYRAKRVNMVPAEA